MTERKPYQLFVLLPTYKVRRLVQCHYEDECKINGDTTRLTFNMDDPKQAALYCRLWLVMTGEMKLRAWSAFRGSEFVGMLYGADHMAAVAMFAHVYATQDEMHGLVLNPTYVRWGHNSANIYVQYAGSEAEIVTLSAIGDDVRTPHEEYTVLTPNDLYGYHSRNGR